MNLLMYQCKGQDRESQDSEGRGDGVKTADAYSIVCDSAGSGSGTGWQH
jgi:hypothetical protein